MIERFSGTLKYEHLYRAPVGDGGALAMEFSRRSRSQVSDSMSRSSDRLRSPGEGHDGRGPRHQEITMPKY
ncbi:MAG TPA: hypothetical protein VF256_02960, partial [Streptosporangiaceae bacterium]